jgi:dTDP-4-amino-4,6-dideoxygalactose transaminase
MVDTIPLFKVSMSDDARSRVDAVLGTGYIGQGPIVEEFEDALSKRFNWDWVVTTNSATSAEHLAMHMLKTSNKRTGSKKVLTTPLTCTATNWPILANGLDIEWVDVDPDTFNIDLSDLERKLTDEVLFIVVVHWGGYPVDLDRLDAILNKFQGVYGYKPAVIEDCAHSFGAEYKKQLIGTHGNYCMFSFQATQVPNTIPLQAAPDIRQLVASKP